MYLTIVILTIAANAGMGVADLARARVVLATSGSVGVPRRWLPTLGVLKIAGASGLVGGLLGVTPLGVAAAAGLVLFFVGAIGAHIRAGKLATLPGPALYLALAVASLLIMSTR